MAKFIKVTEIYHGTDPRPLVINCAFIRSIKLGDKGKDTMITMEGY